jgi:hypothetical protein
MTPSETNRCYHFTFMISICKQWTCIAALAQYGADSLAIATEVQQRGRAHVARTSAKRHAFRPVIARAVKEWCCVITLTLRHLQWLRELQTQALAAILGLKWLKMPVYAEVSFLGNGAAGPFIALYL